MGVPVKRARLLQLTTLVILAGCTTQPAKNLTASNATASGKDVECHQEEHIGSIIAKTVCTTKAQRDDQQAAADDLGRAVQMSVGVCAPTNACNKASN
jgi:hypothetical protein